MHAPSIGKESDAFDAEMAEATKSHSIKVPTFEQEQPQEVKIGGDSDSWNAGKNNYLRLFEVPTANDVHFLLTCRRQVFRLSSPQLTNMYPVKFTDLPESKVRAYSTYQQFAKFVMDEYVIPDGHKNAGQGLACSTVCNGIGALLNMVSTKYKVTGDDRTKLFLTCLEPKAHTDSAKWLFKLKTAIQRTLFKRSMQAGETMDTSASEFCVMLFLLLDMLVLLDMLAHVLLAMLIRFGLCSRNHKFAWCRANLLGCDKVHIASVLMCGLG